MESVFRARSCACRVTSVCLLQCTHMLHPEEHSLCSQLKRQKHIH